MAARRRAEAEEADKLAREAEEMAEKVRLRLEEEAKMAALRAGQSKSNLIKGGITLYWWCLVSCRVVH
tara:strand:+ start:673 stop:876 length:204 start_codon:yes stop_codon:yes gene_type:complete